MQTNPNCRRMWKTANGYHMCMKAVDHEGPCECPHDEVQLGMPMFEKSPGMGGGGQGHRAMGHWGDRDNQPGPVKAKPIDTPSVK